MQLLPDVTLHNGDGLCYADRGFQVNSVTPLSGTAVAVSTFRAVNIPVGTMLYRNTDTAFLKQLHAERHIPVTITLEAEESGFALSIGSYPAGSWIATRHYEHPHTAATRGELARRTQAAQLAKLGDTDYVAAEVHVPEQAYFIPMSALNAWRREVAAAAVEAQDTAYIRQKADHVLDTTHMKQAEMFAEMSRIYEGSDGGRRFTFNIMSFGFKFGIPQGVDMVFDMRFIPNPFYIPSLKKLTGHNKKVAQYVLKGDAVYTTKKAIYLVEAFVGMHNWHKLSQKNRENE